FPCLRTCSTARSPSARPSGSTLSHSTRCFVRLLSLVAGSSRRRHFHLRRRVLPIGRRHCPGSAWPGISSLSREHGDGHTRRRCLSVHGGVGNNGAQFLLSCHFPPSHS